MIRPHLEYVDFIIDSGSKNLIKEINRLQKCALRRIENCKRLENRKCCMELAIQYNIENLRIRRHRCLLIQMHSQSKKRIESSTEDM